MTQIKFSELKLLPTLQSNLSKVGYQIPTPIQAQTIPLVLQGHDVLGIAQTGTGKTAAFCLPIINTLYEKKVRPQAKCPRALILTPTRELAIQIHTNLETYGEGLNQSYAVIFGGVSQGKQVSSLKAGVDVLVATPGRLLDLIEQGYINLGRLEVFVLDEADRMLDMGFIRDIKRILPLLPSKRHNLFFSATMPKEIETLAKTILVNPKSVEVTPPATTVERIQQSVMFVDKKDKINLLVHLLKGRKNQKTLVFVEMKHVANRVTEKLEANGIPAVAIHGNKSQGARQKALQDFTDGRVQVMVATDIASRGIDIDGITHVINYELSNIAESYVHRIGRTARAGADGSAISLVTADEKAYLINVEKTTQQKIPVDRDQPYHSEEAEGSQAVKLGKAKKKLEDERRQESRNHRKQQAATSKDQNSNQKRRTPQNKRPQQKASGQSDNRNRNRYGKSADGRSEQTNESGTPKRADGRPQRASKKRRDRGPEQRERFRGDRKEASSNSKKENPDETGKKKKRFLSWFSGGSTKKK